MENKIICPFCNKENIKRDGKRKTKNRGLIQRYKCRECKKRFILDDGFFRMRNHPNKITCAIDLFYRGVSTRKVQEHFHAFYPHNSDHSTILRWIRKYAKIISNFTDNLKIQTGKEIQVDEMEYKTKKRKSWFIDCIDTETRFMVSSDYVQSRGDGELKNVIKKAKDKTDNQLRIVTTDGFPAYTNIVKKVFGYDKHLRQFNVEHNQVNARRGEGFNYKIERLHNSIRERTKVFREFKRLESAKDLMKGYEIFYNFIRVHQAIGKCPYELATNIKFKDKNKWLELIQLSKSSNFVTTPKIL